MTTDARGIPITHDEDHSIAYLLALVACEGRTIRVRAWEARIRARYLTTERMRRGSR